MYYCSNLRAVSGGAAAVLAAVAAAEVVVEAQAAE